MLDITFRHHNSNIIFPNITIYLCRDTHAAVSAIPKIMVFIDILDQEIRLTDYLYNLLLVCMKKDRKRIIKTFTSILELDTKAEYLEDFHYSNINI